MRDTAHDSRARHWRSDSLGYRPVSAFDSALALFEGQNSNEGGGGNSGGKGGGGGGSGSGGDGGSDDYSLPGQEGPIVVADEHALPMAVIVVYGVIGLALAYLWWTVHIVVQKPEVVTKKVDKVIVWLGEGSARLREWRQAAAANASVHASARQEYRTLCITKEGKRSSRCGNPLTLCRVLVCQSCGHNWCCTFSTLVALAFLGTLHRV